MPIFRVERTKDYTVMSNYHLRDTNISLKAKGLLSMMLSLPEEWDYTIKGLSIICLDGVDSIRAAVKELEKNGYIIRHRLRDKNGHLGECEYVIHEKPFVSEAEDNAEETPEPDSPILENPTQVKPMQANPTQENPTQLNIDILNTDLSITDKSNTDSFLPSVSETEIDSMREETGLTGRRTDRPKNLSDLRKSVKQQIGYDRLADYRNQKQLDEIVEIMLEVMLNRSETIRLGRDSEYPTSYVKERFLQIQSDHIERLLEALKENSSKVVNTKAFLLSALFNAPVTIDNYYTMLANYDKTHFNC